MAGEIVSAPKNVSRGMTVLEILVAVVILTVASTAFLRILAVGDRTRISTLRMQRAVLLASNEAERLKAHAGDAAVIGDTVYEVSFGKQVLIVERGPVEHDEFGEVDSLSEESEIGILVRQAGRDSAIVAFRLLHPAAVEEEY
ncbi:MAG: prepilin-type N-terminal cleavage/methylation domain-containing protein [Chitinivibrionales bacterium]|nr:prepilin-type N-terminal cleavage/methylation domain-containing protein [Chitinivibrionales bacterium]